MGKRIEFAAFFYTLRQNKGIVAWLEFPLSFPAQHCCVAKLKHVLCHSRAGGNDIRAQE
ncbi:MULTISPECIES: hypothetical protein [unclassified Rickettsia]|uniref:hypothetical protein n=1 Tax=unclassified Rickettsia TaxID=114295 RepID=UPI0031333DB9